MMKKEREDLVWEEVWTRQVIKNEWIDLREHGYRMPDGTVFEPYYSYSRRDYAVIVAMDTEGRLICVRQFRQGIKEVTTEFPAGGLERPDGENYSAGGKACGVEDPMNAAKRELLEETGYESDRWEHLLTVPTEATISDNYAYIFLARDCRRVTGQELDITEFLNVELHTADEIEELIKTGGFQQSVHVMAWLLAKDRMRDEQAS
ncbi:MAG: NUDIX hydrolase [Lachnospiraceae bacterium]|nr:NUDIX hydrolase [Lachnospiraceae bacterium]